MSTIGIFLDRNLIVFALSIRSSEKENITSLNCLHLDGSWTRETLLGLVSHRDRHHLAQILPEPLVKNNTGKYLYIDKIKFKFLWDVKWICKIRFTCFFVKFFEALSISSFVMYPSWFLSNTLNAKSAFASFSTYDPLLEGLFRAGSPRNSSLLITLWCKNNILQWIKNRDCKVNRYFYH